MPCFPYWNIFLCLLSLDPWHSADINQKNKLDIPLCLASVNPWFSWPLTTIWNVHLLLASLSPRILLSQLHSFPGWKRGCNTSHIVNEERVTGCLTWSGSPRKTIDAQPTFIPQACGSLEGQEAFLLGQTHHLSHKKPNYSCFYCLIGFIFMQKKKIVDWCLSKDVFWETFSWNVRVSLISCFSCSLSVQKWGVYWPEE